MGSRWVSSGPVACPLAGIGTSCFHLYQWFANLSMYLDCHCLPHPTVSDAVNPGLGLKNLHLQYFQGDLLLLVWDHTWRTSANKPGSI